MKKEKKKIDCQDINVLIGNFLYGKLTKRDKQILKQIKEIDDGWEELLITFKNKKQFGISIIKI